MTAYIAVAAAAGLAGVLFGYFLARLDAIYTVLRENQSGLTLEQRQPSSFFAKKYDKARADVQEKIGQIEIDTRKFVTEIKTDAIQKGSDKELCKKTTQQDTINQSVSKLAQLKGRE